MNPLTREREVAIALLSKEGESIPALAENFPFLLIRCHEAKLEFIVLWSKDSRVSESFWTTVRHRIDNESIESLEWHLSTNRLGTYLPSERIASMIQKLFSAKEFVVQVTPDDSGPTIAVFEPAGLYWAVKPVLEACEVEIN